MINLDFTELNKKTICNIRDYIVILKEINEDIKKSKNKEIFQDKLKTLRKTIVQGDGMLNNISSIVHTANMVFDKCYVFVENKNLNNLFFRIEKILDSQMISKFSENISKASEKAELAFNEIDKDFIHMEAEKCFEKNENNIDLLLHFFDTFIKIIKIFIMIDEKVAIDIKTDKEELAPRELNRFINKNFYEIEKLLSNLKTTD
ncbi:hypothetical protein [Campylobacter armoricus]|uniref:Uncharacterized protein n=1 Tax=Campylobacter armoricus TaxID=2505970 RepID=A0A7L5I3A3_9BACT|nr:hypothetical protein [Campylobacter armoricus]QKF80461.1 hypothetical protein CARM_1585 [Campylobacter armoricus]